VTTMKIAKCKPEGPMVMSDSSTSSRKRNGGAPKGNKNAVGNKGGKGGPSKYDPSQHPHAAQKLCAMGFTDAQLAEFFEVNEVTINRWKVDHVEFMQALQVGKEETDALVERSVLKGITGYYVQTEEINSKGSVKRIRKWIPGNPGVGMRWLACRKPEMYREKREESRRLSVDEEFAKAMENMNQRVETKRREARAHRLRGT
jgi:hypothetical protein